MSSFRNRHEATAECILELTEMEMLTVESAWRKIINILCCDLSELFIVLIQSWTPFFTIFVHFSSIYFVPLFNISWNLTPFFIILVHLFLRYSLLFICNRTLFFVDDHNHFSQYSLLFSCKLTAFLIISVSSVTSLFSCTLLFSCRHLTEFFIIFSAI